MTVVCVVNLLVTVGSLSDSQNYIAQYTLVLATYVFFIGFVLICLPGFISFLSKLLFGLSFKRHREQFKYKQEVQPEEAKMPIEEPIRESHRSSHRYHREPLEDDDSSRSLTPRPPSSDSDDQDGASPHRSYSSESSYDSDSDGANDRSNNSTRPAGVPSLEGLPKLRRSSSESEEEQLSGDDVPLSPSSKKQTGPTGFLARIFTPRGQEDSAPHEREALTPRSQIPSSRHSDSEDDDTDDDHAPLTPRSGSRQAHFLPRLSTFAKASGSRTRSSTPHSDSPSNPLSKSAGSRSSKGGSVIRATKTTHSFSSSSNPDPGISLPFGPSTSRGVRSRSPQSRSARTSTQASVSGSSLSRSIGPSSLRSASPKPGSSMDQ